MELHNIDPYVHSMIYKLASSGLCSGVAGQIMTSLMVKPPQVRVLSLSRRLPAVSTPFKVLLSCI